MDMRRLMDRIRDEQSRFVSYAPEVIGFRPPHHGVHVRLWDGTPGITIECDPGYAGIGAALDPLEALGLGQALIRAAEAAQNYAKKGA